MDDDVARRRLILYSLVRFGGLAIFLLGQTRLCRP